MGWLVDTQRIRLLDEESIATPHSYLTGRDQFSRESLRPALYEGVKAETNSLAVVEALVSRGVDPRLPHTTSDAMNLLHHAVCELNADVVRYLLGCGQFHKHHFTS